MNKYLGITFFAGCLVFLGLSYGSEIRLYQESDLSVLRDMLASNEELLLPGNDKNIQVAETEKLLNSKNYTTKVYVKNNKPVGFITYVKDGFVAPFVEDIKKFDPNKVESVLQGAIQMLNVLEEHRHQGIGTALLTHALEEMNSKDIKVVMLQTKVANAPARSLYEKVGFALLFPISPLVEVCCYRRVSK